MTSFSSRKRRISGLFWGILSIFFLSTPISHGQELYWTENKIIRGSDIDGANAVTVFDGSSLMEGYAVDLVTTATNLYWTEHAGSTTAGGVWRADLDGGNAELLVANDGSFEAPHYLAIDEENGFLYFSDYRLGIFRADLADGGNVTQIVDAFDPGSPPTFTAISLLAPNRMLFLSASNSSLYQVEFTEWGPSVSILDTLSGGTMTYDMAYDAATQTLYYTDYGEGDLWSYSMDTGAADAPLRNDLFQPLGLKLSPAGTHLLITERGVGVSAYRISDQGYQVIASTVDAHFGVAATADPTLTDPTFPEAPPAPPEDGDLLFFTDFDEEGQEPDAPALTEAEGGPWDMFGTPAEGTGLVVADTEDAFGRGTGNQFLRIASARNFNFVARFHPTDVLTFSFDYIGRVNDIDGNRWGNFNIKADTVRAHIVSPRPMSTEFRVAGPYPENDVPLRVDTILNNSAETITYDTPDGGTAELAPTMASLWLYHYTTGQWEQLAAEHRFVRKLGDTEFGEILDNIHFQFDSGEALRSMDLDNIYVFKGAMLGALFEAPGGGGAAGYSAWVGSHFSEAEQGDASVSGPEADPDGDGIENLVEYALGLDPRQPGVDGLPVTGLGSFTVGGETDQYLILEVTRPDSIEDVGYEVQVAGELTNWGTGAVLAESIPNQDGTTTYIYRDSVPMGAEARRFMRLSVSQN